jgi:hypothetical protein
LRSSRSAGRLFLLAQALFLRDVFGQVRRSRHLGRATLALLAIATSPVSLIAGIAGSTAVLVGVAIADTVSEGDRAPTADNTPCLPQD